MSPIKAIISLAALLLTTISALPTEIHERAASCPSGSFRMRLMSQNANGQMVWNGQYATDLGGPMGTTSSAAQALSYYVDSSSNLIENGSGWAACTLNAPYFTMPTNSTAIIKKSSCQANGYAMVECIQTPQYNMCWAGSNKVIQQCGQFISFTPKQVASTDGTPCGPPLSFGIENC